MTCPPLAPADSLRTTLLSYIAHLSVQSISLFYKIGNIYIFENVAAHVAEVDTKCAVHCLCLHAFDAAIVLTVWPSLFPASVAIIYLSTPVLLLLLLLNAC